MPQLHVERHGRIPDEEASGILGFLEECYGRLRCDDLDFVEVLLFENDELWRAYAGAERRKAGVTSAEFDDAFIATHDAWRGVPRISISLQRKSNLHQLVWEGALRHEVGHSILHGSLEYYVFPMPRALLKTAQEFPALASNLTDILYLLTLAVKDMEVTRLLVSNGYVEDQEAYARFVMKPSEQDLEAWRLSSFSAEARVLCLFGRLKDIAPGLVLASRPPTSRISLKELEESVNYLPEHLSRALLDGMTKTFNTLSTDTFLNVQRSADLLVSKVIEPVLRNSPPKPANK